MSANTLNVYSIVLAVLLFCSGAWLVTRGRKVGLFFVTVSLVSMAMKVVL